MTTTHILLALILIALVAPGILRGVLMGIATIIDYVLMPFKLALFGVRWILAKVFECLAKVWL
ncbi:hypothetical protein [Burkholderia vietnamiensis]|uniref:hypothetical protein n=1 Tax=Burkholderia vietnamiensis TaxID=60552 RepID=UPI00264D28B1|nr:hypothetical protein [Burkholderia vietnamiensis]MDN8037450.1 hypothetical protein [Burkholderia vietnamiensis]